MIDTVSSTTTVPDNTPPPLKEEQPGEAGVSIDRRPLLCPSLSQPFLKIQHAVSCYHGRGADFMIARLFTLRQLHACPSTCFGLLVGSTFSATSIDELPVGCF